MGEFRGRLGGVGGLFVYLGRIIRKGLRLVFGIWAGIPLFWDVSPVRSLVMGDVGWFWVRFYHGRGGE